MLITHLSAEPRNDCHLVTVSFTPPLNFKELFSKQLNLDSEPMFHAVEGTNDFTLTEFIAINPVTTVILAELQRLQAETEGDLEVAACYLKRLLIALDLFWD